MKIKDLQGFPEKKYDPRKQCQPDFPKAFDRGQVNGYNQALSELGELEVSLDVEIIEEIIDQIHPQFRIPRLAQAIANSKEVVRIKEER